MEVPYVRHLEDITHTLSQTSKRTEVLNTIMSKGLAAIGGIAGIVSIMTEDGLSFEVVHSHGYPPEFAPLRSRHAADIAIPIADAVRTKLPVYLESWDDRTTRYPDWHEPIERNSEGALVALPMFLEETALGAIRMSFPGPRTLADEDRAFLLTLAGLCAQGLDRARLYEELQTIQEHDRQDKEKYGLSEEMQRVLFDANPQPLWVFDIATLKFLTVNDAAIQQYGYTREEFLAKTIQDIRPAEYRQAVQDQVDKNITGRRFAGEWRHRRKDGTEFWVNIVSNAIVFEGHAGRLVIATDITSQKKAEDEVRQAAAQQRIFLRDVLSSVTDGKLRLCSAISELPPALPLTGPAIALSPTGGIRELRKLADLAAIAVGLPDEKRFDLETAVGEAAMNAVTHTGEGMASVGTNDLGTIQVRIVDQGKGISVENLPRATLARGFSTAATMGHGFKMMLRTADRVSLLTGANGTTVVIEQDR